MMKRVAFLPLLLICFALGILLNRQGFNRIEDLRKIERIPRSTIAALIPGEANVSGKVEILDGQSLRGPDSGEVCVYFNYTIEERRRDSDGETKWETVHRETRHVPFTLRDETGALRILPSDRGTTSLARQHQRQEGDRRYTERRIDPGMTVFAMGLAQKDATGVSIVFEGPGAYVPILSVRSEEQERGAVGLSSLLLTVGGLVFISLAIYCLTRLAGIHQTLTYLLLVALAIMLTMLHQSKEMVQNDLRAAFDRLAHEREMRTGEISAILSKSGITWDGNWQTLADVMDQSGRLLPSDIRQLVSEHRINLMRSIQRAEHIRSGFPERLVAASMGLDRPEKFALTPEEEEQLHSLESAFVPSRISSTSAAILIAIGLAGSLLLGGLGMRKIKTKRWIENIPTVKVRGVVYGVNEIVGEAILPDDATPLTGPLSNEPCIAYHYIVKERRQSGKKTEWVTITNEKQQMPFLCKDSEGAIAVIPDDAEIILRKCTRRRKGKLQYTEYCLPVGTQTYVLGSATVNQETHDSLIIAKGEDRKLPFIISDYSAGELVAKKAATGFLLLNFGFNFFMLGGFSLAGFKGGFGAAAYMTAALTPLVYLLLFMIAVLYNDLVFLLRRCDSMWANIDVALKKRFDLLPQLANVAKAYLEHEKGLQEQLAMLRAGGTAATPEQAGEMVAAEHAALNKVIGIVEEYPELKGNDVMSDLMLRIRNLEDDVALMREGYNHAVETYNSRIAGIPEVLLAKIFKFGPRDFFKTEDRAAVSTA